MKASRFLSNYLKAADFEGSQTVTISDVRCETLGREDEQEEKLVVYFEELQQGLVLGATTLRQLIELCGSDETDEWIGKRVKLWKDKSVAYRGKLIGGIRIREP